MIKIGKIWVENLGSRTRMVASVHIPEQAMEVWEQKGAWSDKKIQGRYRKDFTNSEGDFELWYDVDSCYSYALCPERGDAFLIACLFYAMVSGEDIQCEVPVTDKLLYQVREYVIPSLCVEAEGYRRISIYAEDAPEVAKIDSFVGTGISCGVDSFSTVILHMKPELPEKYKLTHLTLFNTGALNFDGYAEDKPLTKWRKETEIEFTERITLGKAVAEKLNLKFFDVDTNIPEMYQGCFLYSHTHRNCSAILATQKMWRNYYYSSAGEGTQNIVGLKKDQAEYDCLNTMALSLEKLHFYSGGMPYKRLEKIAIIADNPVVQKYINVCGSQTYNCGKCAKCIRTLSELDMLGKLDQFTDSFKDMSYYKSQKWKIRASIMEAQEDDYFSYEMKKYMKDHKITLSSRSKIYHYLLPLRKIWIWLHRKG